MKSKKQKLEENYLVGCIKYKGNYQFNLMPIAWWILNYGKYSPSIFNDSARQSFRNGVINVLDARIEDYLNSVSEDRITSEDIKSAFADVSEEFRQIYFFIDFDKKEYISAFEDIEVETYLPDESWTGKFEDPLEYIPNEILGLNNP